MTFFFNMMSDVDLAKTFSHPIVSVFAQVTFSFLKGGFSFQAVPFVNSKDDFAHKKILKYFPRVPPTISTFFFSSFTSKPLVHFVLVFVHGER